jgi:hypothetical protein
MIKDVIEKMTMAKKGDTPEQYIEKLAKISQQVTLTLLICMLVEDRLYGIFKNILQLVIFAQTGYLIFLYYCMCVVQKIITKDDKQ